MNNKIYKNFLKNYFVFIILVLVLYSREDAQKNWQENIKCKNVLDFFSLIYINGLNQQ